VLALFLGNQRISVRGISFDTFDATLCTRRRRFWIPSDTLLAISHLRLPIAQEIERENLVLTGELSRDVSPYIG
jgi:hypothetical protein